MSEHRPVRYLAALRPPPLARVEAAEARRRLTRLPGADRLRWTARDGWHVTLASYGELAADRLAELRCGLARVARQAAPFTISLAGGEALGDWALAAGVAGDRRALTALASAAGALCEAPAAERYHTYRPHLTLALAPTGGRAVPLAPYVAALRDFAGTPWRVTELALIRGGDPAADRTDGPVDGLADGPGTDRAGAGAAPTHVTAAAWPLGVPW